MVSLDSKDAALDPKGWTYYDSEEAHKHHRYHPLIDCVNLSEIEEVSCVAIG